MIDKLTGGLFALALLAAAAALLVAAPVTPAHAIPLIYTETAHGDLPESVSETPLLEMNVGRNVVGGSLTLGFTVSDRDTIHFTVPTGAQLTDVSLDIGLLPGGTGVFDQVIFELHTGGDLFLSQSRVAVPGNDTALFDDLPPLGAGDYILSTLSMTGRIREGQAQTAGYFIALQMDAVAGGPGTPNAIPAPGSLALLTVGLAGLAGVRRMFI
jgi:hypothetical protein